MRFARPELWWLAGAVVPLALLLLVQRRRRSVVVSALTVWQEVAAAAGPALRGARLRRAVALAATVGAVLATAAAAARPTTGEPPLPPRSLVLVVDGSASMRVTEGGRTRLEHATDVARRAIARRAPVDDVLLWTAAERPRVALHGTAGGGPHTDGRGRGAARGSDRTASRGPVGAWDEALPAAVVAGWGSGSLDEAVGAAATAIARSGRPADLVVVTDEPGAGRPPELPEGATWHRVRVLSTKQANGAVTDVRSRDGVLTVATRGAVGRVVRLTLGGSVIAEAPARQEGRGELAVFRTSDLPPGRNEVVVSLEPRDAFPADDVQRAFAGARRGGRLVVRTRGGSPSAALAALLDALPSALVDRDAALAVSFDAPPAVFAGADVVVTELRRGDGPPRPLAGVAAELVLGARGRGATDVVARVALPHPVTAALPDRELRAARAEVLPAPAGAAVLLTSDAGPLATYSAAPGRARVVVGLSPEDVDVASSTSFALLLRNAVTELARRPEPPPAVVAGEPIDMRALVPAGASAVVLRARGPGGERTRAVDVDPLPLAPAGTGPGTLTAHLPGSAAALWSTGLVWRLPPGEPLDPSGGAGTDTTAEVVALGLPDRSRPPAPLRDRSGLAALLAAACVALLAATVAAPTRRQLVRPRVRGRPRARALGLRNGRPPSPIG